MLVAVNDAWRTLRRAPWSSAAVIALFALTLGACTAVFSVLEATLWRPLPYDSDGRVAIIWHTQGTSTDVIGLSPSDYVAYRSRTRAFDSLGAVSMRGFNLGAPDGPLRVACARISTSIMPMLGVSPAHGRWFVEPEDREGAANVVILSHGLWRDQFGEDPSLLDRTVLLDSVPYTVVGIMPPAFQFPPRGMQGLAPGDCWVPAAFSRAELLRPAFDVVAIGRLRPAVTIAQATDDATTIARQIWSTYPAAVQQQVDLRARVVSLAEEVLAGSKGTLGLLSGAVAAPLLIGCTNVASVIVTRVHARGGDSALRLALGASPRSLVAHVVVECLILALSGALVGILVARVLLQSVISIGSVIHPRVAAAQLNAETLAFAFVCATLAALLAALVPVGQVVARSGQSPADLARFPRRSRARATLVGLQFTVTTLLLICAGVLLHSFLRLTWLPAGIDTKGVLTFSVSLPAASYRSATDVFAFTERAAEALGRHRGVVHAGVSTAAPIGPAEPTVVAAADGSPATPDYKVALLQHVTPDYFRAIGMRLRRGRLFEATDTASALPVALVNELLARQLWPDRDAVGRELTWVAGRRRVTVVGVVENVRRGGLTVAAPPAIFMPLAQAIQPARTLVFAVRSANAPLLSADGARSAFQEIDDALPLHAVQTADELLAASIAPQRLTLMLVSMFAVAALIIAAIGLHALIAHNIALSGREIGVRLAVGASKGQVVRSFVARGLAVSAAGVVPGMLIALAGSRVMSAFVFEIGVTDPVAFVAVPVMLLLVCVIAAALASLRSVYVDPARLLYHE